MAGRILGNYQILDELDHGSLGALYRGRQMSQGTEVVIREIHLASFPVSTRVQLKARFRRELFIQAQLNHPSIARVYQSFVKGDDYYVVSEYVPGMSLRDLLVRQGLPTAPQALYICKQALAALEYAHTLNYLDESDVQRTGIIHRDIKPSNLVIDGQGKLKITDFGIVRMPDSQTLAPPSFQPGTIEYMPPEQVRGLDLDARSDIFSLGVSFYQVLTGHLPYAHSVRSTDTESIDTTLDREPPLISEIRSDVNPALANIFARAITRNPGSRFQTASEFLTAIRQYERSYNQVESPSKPFSSVRHLTEGSAAQSRSQELSATGNPQPENRRQIDRGARNTVAPRERSNPPAEAENPDSESLSGRRVTSPLPKPDRRDALLARGDSQALARSVSNEEQFFMGQATSRNRVGWVVAAALTLIAVFAGFYLFVFKESRTEGALKIKAPETASAAVNPEQPAASPTLRPVDLGRLDQAREADRLGKFSTAITLYVAFLEAAPPSPETETVSAQLDRLRKFVAHLNSAKSAFNRGDYKTARDNYTAALKLRPYSRLVQNGIAACDSRLAGGPGPSTEISTRPRRANPQVNN